jgi:sulfatase maturation enzyme AslB (radical SAM superfamily)
MIFRFFFMTTPGFFPGTCAGYSRQTTKKAGMQQRYSNTGDLSGTAGTGLRAFFIALDSRRLLLFFKLFSLNQGGNMAHILKRIVRIWNSKPVACHLYVTEQCNLHCEYCTEFDNSIPHPSLDTVKQWVDKIKELGCMRIGIQGGEPLKHPDIVEIVRYIKSKKMGCSMSSNAFLLTDELQQGLEAAGLDAIHVSIDSMHPQPSTKKCIDLVENKLEMLRKSKISLHLTSVLFKESVPECRRSSTGPAPRGSRSRRT